MLRINLIIARRLLQLGLLERANQYLCRALGNANTCNIATRPAIFTALNALKNNF
jgi:hypothetical protein